MKTDWKKIKNVFRWKNIRKYLFNFLERKISWVIFILIFALAGYGSYLWYNFVYHPGWSEERKRLYREEKGKGTALNRIRFDEALRNYGLRGDNFNKKTENQKDIFGLEKSE